jgi:hypothetical protein
MTNASRIDTMIPSEYLHSVVGNTNLVKKLNNPQKNVNGRHVGIAIE